MNQTSLTRHPLYERRKLLHSIINPVERRFEIHNFSKANTVQDIETELRKIIAEGYFSRHSSANHGKIRGIGGEGKPNMTTGIDTS
jgi:ATP dependent DNA ligase domain